MSFSQALTLGHIASHAELRGIVKASFPVETWATRGLRRALAGRSRSDLRSSADFFESPAGLFQRISQAVKSRKTHGTRGLRCNSSSQAKAQKTKKVLAKQSRALYSPHSFWGELARPESRLPIGAGGPHFSFCREVTLSGKRLKPSPFRSHVVGSLGNETWVRLRDFPRTAA